MSRILAALLIFSMITTPAWTENSGMMGWPFLVQLQWDSIHNFMIKNCKEKFPKKAYLFQNAVAQWRDRNSSTIAEINESLVNRVQSLEGTSESQAKEELRKSSADMTNNLIAGLQAKTTEKEWQEGCSGKLAESLGQVEFSQYRDQFLEAVSTLPLELIFPLTGC